MTPSTKIPRAKCSRRATLRDVLRLWHGMSRDLRKLSRTCYCAHDAPNTLRGYRGVWTSPVAREFTESDCIRFIASITAVPPQGGDTFLWGGGELRVTQNRVFLIKTRTYYTYYVTVSSQNSISIQRTILETESLMFPRAPKTENPGKESRVRVVP